MSKKSNIETVTELWRNNKSAYTIHLTTDLPFGEIAAIIESCNDAKAKDKAQLRANKVLADTSY